MGRALERPRSVGAAYWAADRAFVRAQRATRDCKTLKRKSVRGAEASAAKKESAPHAQPSRIPPQGRKPAVAVAPVPRTKSGAACRICARTLAESDRRIIRLACQGLKCHYNGIIITRRPTGAYTTNGATGKPLGGEGVEPDLADRNVQLSRSAGDAGQARAHRERSRHAHPGARSLRHARGALPRNAHCGAGGGGRIVRRP